LSGSHHTFSVKVKNNNNTELTVNLRVRDGNNGANLSNVPSFIIAPGQTRQVHVTTHTLNTEDTVTPGISIYSDANAKVNAEIFDVQLERKPYPTPFTPNTRAGKVRDYSAHNPLAALELQTTPRWITDGVIDGAYRFGLGSLNQIIAPMQTPISEKLTLCAWIYPTQYPTDKSTIIKGENPNGYYLSLSANGALASYWYNTSNPGYHLTSTGAVPLNDWSYVCTVWNGTNNKLYVNANPLQTIATTGAGISSTGIVIGAESTARQFKGNIDEVLIYNRNLNDTEILNNYLIGRQQLDQQ
jgi:hypothetical protein